LLKLPQFISRRQAKKISAYDPQRSKLLYLTFGLFSIKTLYSTSFVNFKVIQPKN